LTNNVGWGIDDNDEEIRAFQAKQDEEEEEDDDQEDDDFSVIDVEKLKKRGDLSEKQKQML